MQLALVPELANSHGADDRELLTILEEMGIDYLRAMTYSHSEAEHEAMLSWLRSEAGAVWLSYFNVTDTDFVIERIDLLGRRTIKPAKTTSLRCAA